MLELVKKWRRDLHQIPELGLNEYKTASYIREQLTDMGLAYETYQTSTFVYFDASKEHTIAFRSDIDGLQVTEKNDVDFKSTHDSCMHACGHDGHMATLLALAYKLKDEELNHNVLLIFQMAEEAPGGAKLLIEAGILDKYNVEAIFGMHIMPDIDEGTIACKAGPLMAQCGELNVTVHGKGAHAGQYYKGIDALYIATQLYMQFKAIFVTDISPFQPCLLNIGEFKAGTVRNIVASTASFYGTLRTYDSKLFLDIVSKMKAIAKQFEISHNCVIDIECEPMYPPVLNDENLYNQMKSFTTISEMKEPLMLAEDFSYYQTKVPGVFFFLGTKTDCYYSGLHTDTFNFNEHALLQGLETFLQIARNIKL